ncbi:MAG TPA: TolC family protein [Geobacteraceae bacterium]
MKRCFISLLLLATLSTSSHAELLTLADCLDRAARQNSSLKAAVYDEKIAADGVQLADSTRLPRIDLQTGYIAQLEPQAVNIGPRAQETQQADYAFLNFSVYQTIYDFGRTADRKEQAVLQQQAAANRYRASEQDTFLQVVQAYYGILQNRRLLAVANDELIQRQQHLQVAKALYEEGVTTRNDLLQAEVKLANSRQKGLATANAVENGWLSLNYLTGQAPGFRGDLEDPLQQPGEQPATETAALTNRYEIKAQHAVIKASEAAVRESKTAYYPELFAKLALDYAQNDKVSEQAIMSATIGLKINLYDGLATTSRQRQTVKALAQERERLRNLEATIGLELQTARNDMVVASERIKVTEQAIRQSEENLRINTDRYQAQVGTATEVIDAQTLLSQTKNDYYQANFDYQVAAARVKHALGQL